ncbi:MAG: winged helix-turn-helix domain-containing protein [Thermoplasmatota archaeon]
MAEEIINIEATFGINAGKVWNALSKLGTATSLMIRNETKLTSDEVYGALGWLAREGKVSQIRDGKLTKFRLVEAQQQ